MCKNSMVLRKIVLWILVVVIITGFISFTNAVPPTVNPHSRAPTIPPLIPANSSRPIPNVTPTVPPNAPRPPVPKPKKRRKPKPDKLEIDDDSPFPSPDELVPPPRYIAIPPTCRNINSNSGFGIDTDEDTTVDITGASGRRMRERMTVSRFDRVIRTRLRQLSDMPQDELLELAEVHSLNVDPNLPTRDLINLIINTEYPTQNTNLQLGITPSGRIDYLRRGPDHHTRIFGPVSPTVHPSARGERRNRPDKRPRNVLGDQNVISNKRRKLHNMSSHESRLQHIIPQRNQQSTRQVAIREQREAASNAGVKGMKPPTLKAVIVDAFAQTQQPYKIAKEIAKYVPGVAPSTILAGKITDIIHPYFPYNILISSARASLKEYSESLDADFIYQSQLIGLIDKASSIANTVSVATWSRLMARMSEYLILGLTPDEAWKICCSDILPELGYEDRTTNNNNNFKSNKYKSNYNRNNNFNNKNSNKPICRYWIKNNGRCRNGNKCKHAHICTICFGKHHSLHCPTKDK